ncbi:MAG: hypothetical protein ACLPX5_10585 [Dissulfurispiraceae bacterium]
MRKKRLIEAIIVSSLGIGVYSPLSGRGKDVQYRTENVFKGNMAESVIAAGTLHTLTNVLVENLLAVR